MSEATIDEALTDDTAADDSKATTAQQDLSATAGTPATQGRRAVAHNQHDVDTLERECQKLHQAIAERGGQVDVAAVTARAQAFTAIKLLVDHGLCTEAEAQAALLLQIRGMLGSILQSVEVARLQEQQQAGQVQAVRQPDLILPANHAMRRRLQD